MAAELLMPWFSVDEINRKPTSIQVIGPWTEARCQTEQSLVLRRPSFWTHEAARALKANDKLLCSLCKQQKFVMRIFSDMQLQEDIFRSPFDSALQLLSPLHLFPPGDPRYTFGVSDVNQLLENTARMLRERTKHCNDDETEGFRALVLCHDTRNDYWPDETRSALLREGRHLGMTPVLLRDSPLAHGTFIDWTLVLVHDLFAGKPAFKVANQARLAFWRKLELRFGPFQFELGRVWDELVREHGSSTCFLVFGGPRTGRVAWFKL
jgi:hypothetical protein